MTQNKIQPTATPAGEFVAAVPNDRRRQDAETLLGLMHQLTGQEPVMWGPTMIGFGGKHRTGAACLYINKLDDVDIPVLEELITLGHTHMVTENHTHGED